MGGVGSGRGSGGIRWGAGRKRKCTCNKFGCVTCMARSLSQHYYAQKIKDRVVAPPVKRRVFRYEWDRTI